MTKGELGTRGSALLRNQESDIASKKMKLSLRGNLGFQDGFFENNETNKLEVVKQLRAYKPNIVLCNAKEDRHPDHGRAASLIYDACFLSGLEKIKTRLNNIEQEPFRPSVVYNYIQYNAQKPDFIVDISSFMHQKMDIIKSYASQFYDPDSQESETIISNKEFLDLIINRDADLGRVISVDYAEGFTVNRYVGSKNIFDLL